MSSFTEADLAEMKAIHKRAFRWERRVYLTVWALLISGSLWSTYWGIPIAGPAIGMNLGLTAMVVVVYSAHRSHVHKVAAIIEVFGKHLTVR